VHDVTQGCSNPGLPLANAFGVLRKLERVMLSSKNQSPES